MEELDRAPADAAPSSSSFSSSNNVAQFGAASSDSSSSTDPQVEEEETAENGTGNSILIQQRTNVSYDAHLNVTENEETSRWIQDKSESCVVIILTFWFFVSIIMILGVYGSSSFLLGPNSSILIRPNPLFVECLKVEELEETSNQPTLYGFSRTPALDVVTTWSETLNTSLPARSHQEWVFFLNQGSQMNVSYNVTSPGISLIFVIAQGHGVLSQWLEDPSYPNATLSWNTIHGSGGIQQDIYMPSSYHVALANLNVEAVKVELTLEIRAFLYNTSGACYKCSLSRGQCNLELSFDKGSTALLTSPNSTSTLSRGENQWYVKLSYGPRWMTYIVGTDVK